MPISKTIRAKPHRPVYSIHRYFARRPYNVFSNLIQHYSKENDVILDPFVGGGVTVVESILLNRNAIGIDLNPMSIFITREQIKTVDLDVLEKEVNNIERKLHDLLRSTFGTECSTCNNSVIAEWFEYAAISNCDKCKSTFIVNEANKVKPATWECPHCKSNSTNHQVKVVCDSETKFEIVNKHYFCKQCDASYVEGPNKKDLEKYKQSHNDLTSALEQGLWIPNVAIPECNMEKESALFKKGIVNFNQLFTHRHLHVLGSLRRLIINSEPSVRDTLLFIFSATLRYTNRMTTRNESWRKNKPLEWSKPGYWLPQSHLEANPLTQFNARLQAYLRGKRNLSKVSNDSNFNEHDIQEIVNQKDFVGFSLENCSSTSIPLPDSSIDAIITDPPYGSYIHYADLTNFWAVWLPEIGMGRPITTTEEAVVARKKFPGSKNFDDYRSLLQRCFKECHRVLKPDSHMVLTFNNREPAAWAALIIAARNSGFQLAEGGLIYQPGTSLYKHTTNNRRIGSLRGDFIFTFTNTEIKYNTDHTKEHIEQIITEQEIVNIINSILTEKNSLTPEALFSELYMRYVPIVYHRIMRISSDETQIREMLKEVSEIEILDSAKQRKLTKYFDFNEEFWSIKEDSNG